MRTLSLSVFLLASATMLVPLLLFIVYTASVVVSALALP